VFLRPPFNPIKGVLRDAHFFVSRDHQAPCCTFAGFFIVYFSLCSRLLFLSRGLPRLFSR
jgi:hypothetical protein